MERWGIGYDALSQRFPRLVWCRVSGFGADGPLGALPGYDAAVQAMTGIMSINGEADGGPLRVGLPVVDMVTGLNATIGVLLALQERDAQRPRPVRRGGAVRQRACRCCIRMRPTGSSTARRRSAPATRIRTSIPTTRCATGTEPIFVAVGNDRQFASFCRCIGVPALADDPLYRDARLALGATARRSSSSSKPLLARFDGRSARRRADGRRRARRAGAVGGRGARSIRTPRTAAWWSRWKAATAASASPIKLSRTPASYRHAPLTPGEGFEDS